MYSVEITRILNITPRCKDGRLFLACSEDCLSKGSKVQDNNLLARRPPSITLGARDPQQIEEIVPILTLTDPSNFVFLETLTRSHPRQSPLSSGCVYHEKYIRDDFVCRKIGEPQEPSTLVFQWPRFAQCSEISDGHSGRRYRMTRNRKRR